MKRPRTRFTAALPLALVGALIAVQSPAWAGEGEQKEAPNRISSRSGKVFLSRRDLSCLPAGSVERQPLGALLAEPGAEGLYPYAAGLTAIVDLGPSGYAFTAATRAFSTGPLAGGGDLMLAGLDRSFSPLWATVIGGPAADGPSSMTRTADGGFAVVGITQTQFFSPMRWFKQGQDAALLAKFARDGGLEWAQVHAPGGDMGANPIVLLPGGDLVIGGVAQIDGRAAGFVMRSNERGETVWGRWLGRDPENGVTWMTATPAGDLLVAGARQAVRRPAGADLSQVRFDVWIAKIGGDGTVAWARSYALDSGGARVVMAPTLAGGLVVARESRFDDRAGVSRFPVFAVDARGEVQWAGEYELPGEASVSSLAPVGPKGYLLFGTAIRAGGESGGPFTLELDATGHSVAGTWVDVAAAASTPGRRAIVGPGPLSVSGDADGRFVVMGETVDVSAAILVQAKGAVGRIPQSLKSDLKSMLYFIRVDETGRAGACSLPLRASQRSIDVRGVALDLPATDMPAQKPPFIPESKLTVERFGPRG